MVASAEDPRLIAQQNLLTIVYLATRVLVCPKGVVFLARKIVLAIGERVWYKGEYET